MKGILCLLVVAVHLTSCNTKPKAPSYVINGKVIGADGNTFYLQKREAGSFVILDSAVSVKGEFKIQGGFLKCPERVYLSQKDKKGSVAFYLENSAISITGSIDSLANVKVAGSKTQDEYIAYQELLKPFENSINKLDEEQNAFNKKFIADHPKSYITPSIVNNMSYELEAADIEILISKLDTTIANVTIIKDIEARVAVMKTVAIGQKAPDFTMNDVNDKPISLSSKIGTSKLLLIDFWASWCGPCRQENPNVVKVYKEYNKKGFDVYGVSLDKKKENWLKAIEKDQLTWTHVSDLQFWNNVAAKLYAVNSIPSNFLLDQKGTIIGRNLRGEALANKVKELLGGK